MFTTYVTFLLVLVPSLAGVQPARADSAAVYVQGDGGLVIGDVSDVDAAAAQPDHRAAVGYAVGARLLFVEGFLDRRSFADGSVTRWAFGGHASVDIGWIRAYGRAGVGVVSDTDGALGGTLDPSSDDGNEAVDRAGVLTYVGGGFEQRFVYALSLGLGIQGESFWLEPRQAADRDDEPSHGADVYGFAYLKLELSL